MNKWEYKALLEESADNGVFPSTSPSGDCFYRENLKSDCPKRCAIGLLIPDSLYSDKMESKDICTLLKDHPEIREYITVDGLTTAELETIQYCHDALEDWDSDQFKENLNELKCFEDLSEI